MGVHLTPPPPLRRSRVKGKNANGRLFEVVRYESLSSTSVSQAVVFIGGQIGLLVFYPF